MTSFLYTHDELIGDCVTAASKGKFHMDRLIEASLAFRKK